MEEMKDMNREIDEEMFEDEPEVEMPEGMAKENEASDEANAEAENAKDAEANDAGETGADAGRSEPDAAGQTAAETSASDGEAAETDTTETGDSKSQKGGFFKKKEKKDKKDEKIEELTDRVRRQMAEFDNFRKRTEKEKSQMFETGAKSIVEKILPVIDNFERGLGTVSEEEKGTPFVEGMEKIYKQMMTMLDEAGVKPIEAVGKEFDPNLHNAVMHVDDDSLGENVVAEEFQKGYMYRDSVVRHSMVKVAN